MADGQDYFLILLIVSVLLNFIFPVPLFLSPPITYSGFLIIIFGLVLAFWSRSLFLRNSTTLSVQRTHIARDHRPVSLQP